MSNLKLFFLLSLFLFLSSCGTVRDAFSNQKKNSSDEFLVEKKSPLVLPPDYNELPVPGYEKKTEKFKKNKIKNLISIEENQTNQNTNSNQSKNENLEKSLLEKIKKN